MIAHYEAIVGTCIYLGVLDAELLSMSEQAVDNAATGKSEAEIQQKASFADAARIVALQMSKRLGGQPRDLDFIKLRSPPSQILERLYLGDLFHAQDKELLKNLQITHVVSVLEWAPSFSHDLALRKLHIRLRDSGLEDILKHLDRTTEFIRDALKDSSSVVLVSTYMLEVMASMLRCYSFIT